MSLVQDVALEEEKETGLPLTCNFFGTLIIVFFFYLGGSLSMENLCTLKKKKFFISFKLFDCSEGGRLFIFIMHHCMMTIMGHSDSDIIVISITMLTFKDSTHVHKETFPAAVFVRGNLLSVNLGKRCGNNDSQTQ